MSAVSFVNIFTKLTALMMIMALTVVMQMLKHVGESRAIRIYVTSC